jgi:hypothetical protein
VPSPRALAVAVTLLALPSLAQAVPEVLPAVGVGEAPSQPVADKLTQLVRSAVRASATGPTVPAPGAVLAEEARARYFDLDFRAAAALARQSVTRSLEHPEEFGDGSGYVLAHVLEALALRELKDPAGAAAAFRAALAVRPDLSLSENDYSPDAIAALARARETLAAAPVGGDVVVSSAPPFARVFVDGRAFGETPTTVKGLPPGRHLLELTLDGRLPHREWLELGAEPVERKLPLAVDPAATARATLSAAVRAGAGEGAATAAATLAKELQRDVVVLATGARAGRVTLVAARVTASGETRRVATSVDEDLLEAQGATRLLAAAVLGPTSATPGAVGTPGQVDFSRAFLGLVPPPPPAAPPPPPPALTSRPWFWVAVGAAVVAAGAGAGAGVAWARAPRSLGVTVELPR